MYCYLDTRCKVFANSKTLDERFTRSSPRSCFIMNNGYTTRHNNYVTERKAFENRRDIVIHKRTSQYEGGNFKQIEGKIFGSENKNLKFQEQLNRYDYMFRKNSYVDGSGPVQRSRDRHFKNKNVIREDYYLNDSNGREPVTYKPNSSRNDTKMSPYKWKCLPPTKEELDDELDSYMAERKVKQTPVTPINDVDLRKFRLEIENYLSKNSYVYGHGPVKRTLDGHFKNKNVKVSKDREPIIYKPDSNKAKRAKLSKEELDEEMDRYMAERKIKRDIFMSY